MSYVKGLVNCVIMKTKNLQIELLKMDHARSLLDYYEKNKEHLRKWKPKRDLEYYTIDHFKKKITDSVQDRSRGEIVRFVLKLKYDPSIIGVINYTKILNGKCWLGYSISKEYEGKGLIVEALNQTNQVVFDKKILK